MQKESLHIFPSCLCLVYNLPFLYFSIYIISLTFSIYNLYFPLPAFPISIILLHCLSQYTYPFPSLSFFMNPAHLCVSFSIFSLLPHPFSNYPFSLSFFVQAMPPFTFHFSHLPPTHPRTVSKKQKHLHFNELITYLKHTNYN